MVVERSSLTSDGFRVWLLKAVRVQENGTDWTIHTIDYGAFKERLKFFARRRASLRGLLRQSTDGRINEYVLMSVLGNVDKSIPLTIMGATLDKNKNNTAVMENNSYVPFVDAEAVDPVSASGSASLPPSEASGSQSSNFGGGGGGGGGKNKRSVMRRVSIVERREMLQFLATEMDKVQLFYLSQWQLLSSRLEQMQQTGISDYELGDEVLELTAFCVMNIITTRQMLIRYDAFARTFEGTPMLNFYMKKVVKHQTPFRKILQHAELTAIANSYAASLQSPDQSIHFETQQELFRDILLKVQSAQSMAASGHVLWTDSIIYTLRDFVLTAKFEDRLGLEPAYLTMRGKSLTQEIRQLAEWRKKKHEVVQPQREEKSLTGMQVFHLTLNLLSAFLYCMNYYIVEPSSTMYVNRLGAHDAMSGMMIGMLPLAAFLTAIPYSMWTNKSFRHPFLMSCFMMIIGNLVYGLADNFHRVEIALAGRFISGLGAPKCIIRRYMADTTPVSLRTSVNALFGMVVAAGSAMGPAMAVILNRFEYTVVFPGLGFVTFNGLTLPGYFMACLWFTFSIIVLVTFEEPDREGLEEQKQLELQGQMIGLSPTASRADFSYSEMNDSRHDNDLNTILSGEDNDYRDDLSRKSSFFHGGRPVTPRWMCCGGLQNFLELVTFPVRLCLGLLFAKVFTIEALVSATSALTKNRYGWQVEQVGTLGFSLGLLVIPFSVFIGRLSLSYHDHVLMKWLVCIGCVGLFVLIDVTDLVSSSNVTYNEEHVLAVHPKRYICGYFLVYLSIQTFEGVIGSTLSKVIPTALASGTFNSGLLATLVDTSGRACGDLFISAVGFIEIRQLMDLLFIPAFMLMCTCLVVIIRYRDMLAV